MSRPRRVPSPPEQALLAHVEGDRPPAPDDTLLDAYLLGSLDEEAREAFEALLAEDAALRARVESARAFVRALDVHDEAARVPVAAAAAAPQPAPRRAAVPASRRRSRWVLLAPVAAAAAVLLMLRLPVTRSSGGDDGRLQVGGAARPEPPAVRVVMDGPDRWTIDATGRVVSATGPSAEERMLVEQFLVAVLADAPSPATGDTAALARWRQRAPEARLAPAALRWAAGDRRGALTTLQPVADEASGSVVAVVAARLASGRR